ncbi:4Fe-4S dicluster domain-containing protein [bacterium]|nr:4Fe-4S dicluster domain-containing protein [bacterium]
MPIEISLKTVDREITRKIKEISGEPLTKCMQCGTCSGLCPMEESGDISPRGLIHLVNLGQKDLVIKAEFSWLCASCYRCELRCPRGLDIPKIVEAIRLLKLRLNEDYVKPFEIEEERIYELPQIAMVSSFRKHTA